MNKTNQRCCSSKEGGGGGGRSYVRHMLQVISQHKETRKIHPVDHLLLVSVLNRIGTFSLSFTHSFLSACLSNFSVNLLNTTEHRSVQHLLMRSFLEFHNHLQRRETRLDFFVGYPIPPCAAFLLFVVVFISQEYFVHLCPTETTGDVAGCTERVKS